MRSKKSLLAAVVTLGLGACGTNQQPQDPQDPGMKDPDPPVMTDPPKMFSLTSGADSFTGADTNDSFHSSVSGGLGAGDVLDGAGGIDSLTVNETAAIAPDNVTIRNIEQASLTSMSTVKVDTTSWTGLASLTTQSQGASTITAAGSTAVSATASGLGQEGVTVNGGGNVTVTATGSTTGTIIVGKDLAPAGAVAISNTSIGAVTMGDIVVNGGKSVSVTQAATNEVNTTTTLGDVTVNGNADTTAVSISSPPGANASATAAGVQLGTFMVVDKNAGSDSKAGTITSVAASNYRVFAMAGTALQSLSLTGGAGNVIIDNSGLMTPVHTALALKVNGLGGGTLDDADIYKSLAITTEGKPSRLANCTFGALTSLQLAGDQPLTFTSTAGMTALKTVSVSGAAGLLAGFDSAAGLTSLDASATSGNLRVSIDPSRTEYKGGSGTDALSLSFSGDLAFDINLGAGDDSLNLGSRTSLPKAITGGPGDDTIVLVAGFAAANAATIASKVTGFEGLELTGLTNQTIDLSALGGYQRVVTRGGNGATFTNMPSGGTLWLTGAGTAYTVANSAFAGGSDDTLNLKLSDGSGAGVAFAPVGITASGVENINITSLDTQATPSGTFRNALTLLGNSAKSITASGNAGLTLTATSTALSNVDASQLAAKSGLVWTSGALAASTVTVKGSATGQNIFNGSAATDSVRYTGGSDLDSVTLVNNKDHVVALGDGVNSLVISGGNNTISGGSGNDTVYATSGNNTINLGDGTNTVSVGTGTNTITTGSGDDTITFGGTAAAGQTINVGTGKDTVVVGGIPASAAAFTTVSGLGSGDIVNLSGTRGGATSISLQTSLGSRVSGQSTFTDYLNACAAEDGGTFTVIKWFQFEGNTYIVHDTSAMGTFQDGADTVIKLSGQIDLSSATVAGGVITL